jgi:hypothetical protein
VIDMDRRDRTRTTNRPPAGRPRGAAPGPPRPRRPSALSSQPGSRAPPRRPPGLPISAIVRGLPATVAAIGLGFFVVQAVLGWGLGVAGAGITVLVAAMLFAVLVVTDALDVRQDETQDEEERYDLVTCAAVAVAVAIAIACLYLPLPWGGLAAALVLSGLVVTLRVL